MASQTLQSYNGSLLKKTFVYDFSAMGGSTGDTFTSTNTLPVGAVPVKATVDVIKVPTSAASTATIAITLAGTPGHTIKTATVITDAFYATKGKKHVDLSTVITAIETPTFAIAVQNLTAGLIKVIVYYTL